MFSIVCNYFRRFVYKISYFAQDGFSVVCTYNMIRFIFCFSSQYTVDFSPFM